MYDILFLLAAGLLVFFGFRVIKNQPELFQIDKITSALGTLGLLAIFLMALVVFSIVLLRAL